MTATMFASYDPSRRLEPQFFLLEDTNDDSATIAGRAQDLGVSLMKGFRMRELVSMSGNTALIHFGTLARFLDTPAKDVAAAYAIGSSSDDKDAIVRMAEMATVDRDFMAGMWDHRARRRIGILGRPTPKQEQLQIALVADLLNPARYTATNVDSEARA